LSTGVGPRAGCTALEFLQLAGTSMVLLATDINDRRKYGYEFN